MVLGVIGIFKPPRKELISSPLARDDAGCFVLLTNLLGQQANWPADELLSLYKSHIGIEKNFSF